MPARSAIGRKWIAGALHIGRAAAFLTIATGVNGTLAAIWPHYEPIYAYLLAVVIVAFLSSAMLGVTAAVAAVILYDWMFSPVHSVPSLSIAIPMAVAVLLAIATRAIVPIWNRPQLPPPEVEQQLLPTIQRPEEPPVVEREVRVERVVDEERVNQLTSQLAEMRSAARLREADLSNQLAEAAAAARARETDLTNQLVATMAAGRSRESELQREIASLQSRLEDQGTRSIASRRDYDEMRERLAQSESRVTALQQGLDAAQRRANEEHARANREAGLRAQVETASHESLQKAVGDLGGKYEAAMREAKQRLDVAMKRLETTQKELKEERARSEREAAMRTQLEASGNDKLSKAFGELNIKHQLAVAEAQKRDEAAQTKLKAIQRELDRTLASLGDEHNRADREARLRAQLEAAARETLHRTADVSQSHQREAAEARQAAQAAEERARAAEETVRTADARVQQAQEQTNLADERARRAEERALVAEQQFEQLRFEMSELRSSLDGHQNAAVSSEQRAIALESELDQLRGTSAEQLREAEEARAALQDEIAGLRRELEAAELRDDLEIAATAKLSAELATAKQEIEKLKAERTTITKEFDERLKSIVDGINADYESAVGEALIEKEAAKAEVRALSNSSQEVQALRSELAAARSEADALRVAAQTQRDQMSKSFDEKLNKIVAGITADYENTIGDSLIEREAAKAELRSLTKKIEILQQKLDEEKKTRDKIDAEWSEKLQRIVTHLTEDHEADIGEAIVAKEAARAEARTLSARVAALQQRLEEERQTFQRAADRWQLERASAPARRSAITPTMEEALPKTMEQEANRPAVILIVHSNANVRAMGKHSLQQLGYTVITAADGLEGLRMATQQKPDVVLAEAVMPKMNARELVQLLKSRHDTADIKVILMSDADAAERSARSSDFHADEVVRDFNDVRAALTNVLSRRDVN